MEQLMVIFIADFNCCCFLNFFICLILDNVHFQNSAVLAKILRDSFLDLEFLVYPDIQHTPDIKTQRHLYKKITKFLLQCYDIDTTDFDANIDQRDTKIKKEDAHIPNKDDEN
jgi:hypothetical protein